MLVEALGDFGVLGVTEVFVAWASLAAVAKTAAAAAAAAAATASRFSGGIPAIGVFPALSLSDGRCAGRGSSGVPGVDAAGVRARAANGDWADN